MRSFMTLEDRRLLAGDTIAEPDVVLSSIPLGFENEFALVSAQSAGDVDGDGFDDIIMSRHFPQAPSYEVRWDIIFGSAIPVNTNTTVTSPAYTITAGDFDNTRLVAIDDVTGDGNPDVQRLANVFLGFENSVFTTDQDHDPIPDEVFPPATHAFDFNGDGIDDLFDVCGNEVWIDFRELTPGDTDGDGEVNFADFLTLSKNFGETNRVWADGDFDASGDVDFADFLILSSNFGKTLGN